MPRPEPGKLPARRRISQQGLSCGVAGGGAGYARAARRAGSCCPVRARRPRRVPPRRRWVKNHPPRPGARTFACCPGVTAFLRCLVCPAARGTAAGTPWGKRARGQVALALTRALHPCSGPCPARPGALGRAAWPRGCWLPGRGAGGVGDDQGGAAGLGDLAGGFPARATHWAGLPHACIQTASRYRSGVPIWPRVTTTWAGRPARRCSSELHDSPGAGGVRTISSGPGRGGWPGSAMGGLRAPPAARWLIFRAAACGSLMGATHSPHD